jgi:CRP-like cAMP-binding protein
MNPSRNSEFSCESIFSGLDCIQTKYLKGSVIFMEGTPIMGLHFLQSGKVKLMRNEEDGKVVILRLCGKHEMLGHRCFFSRSNYGMTASALEDCNVTFLEKKHILELIKTQPEISYTLLNAFGVELEESDKRTSSLMRKNAGGRLAEFFLALLEKNCEQDKRQMKIDLHLSREEIASVVGTTSETVTRYITTFKTKGFMKEVDRSLYILKPDELRQFSMQYHL